MSRFYPPEDYDRNLALKPTLLLAACMFYGALPLILVVLAYNPSPKLQTAFDYLRHYGTPSHLLSGIPATLLLTAWLKRLPGARSVWKTIWHRGKWLLTLSLASHFFFMLSMEHGSLFRSYALSDADRLILLYMGADVLALYYIWRVRRVSDVFADFPAKPKED